MGFRFRKTISILPGLRLNISKSGVSTSIGRPGATVNIGRRGVRGTVGLPGTGMSYSDMIFRPSSTHSSAPDSAEERMPGAEVSRAAAAMAFGGGRLLLIVGAVVVAAVAALLFTAGLMSARQQSPSGGFQPSASEVAPVSAAARATAADDAAGGRAHVGRGVNCRANPNVRAAVSTVLSGDEELTVVRREAGWARVTTGDHDCWVASDLVR